MHSIMIKDEDSNWTSWGNLVRNWIDNPGTRPANVGALRTAMTGAGVVGLVAGGANRGVTFVDYTDGGNIVIPLPTPAMVRVDERLLKWIAMRAAGQCKYPLPTFYAVAFGGAAMVDLSENELLAMGTRRLGEYVINECM
jgi:hypothetical protein